MISIVIGACASMLATSTFLVLARHGQILSEIGMRTILVGGLLMLPFAPFVLLFGAGRIGAVPALILASACCLPSFFIAHRVGQILEREGTDRVNEAREAMSKLMGAAISMLSLVIVMGIFLALSYGVIGPEVND